MSRIFSHMYFPFSVRFGPVSDLFKRHKKISFQLLKHGRVLLISFFSLLQLSSFGQAVKEPNSTTGFLDFNAYYDSRNYTVLTYNIMANLSERWQYFSLTNYESAPNSFDLESLYAEHNLRWAVRDDAPLDATLQYVVRSGANNDDFRLGMRWTLSKTEFLEKVFRRAHVSYSVNPMFIQFRRKESPRYMTIIEHVFRMNVAPKIFNNRVYIAGFADQNFNLTKTKGSLFNWVTEQQLGVRIFDEFYLVLEHRVNQYLTQNQTGLGYGIEYKIKF